MRPEDGKGCAKRTSVQIIVFNPKARMGLLTASLVVCQAQRALAGDEAVSGSRFTRRARLGPRDRADAQLSVGERVNLFSGEPDALAALVRLDERGVKTEQDAASEAPAEERVGNR
jgi:hypothetical protein